MNNNKLFIGGPLDGQIMAMPDPNALTYAISVNSGGEIQEQKYTRETLHAGKGHYISFYRHQSLVDTSVMEMLLESYHRLKIAETIIDDIADDGLIEVHHTWEAGNDANRHVRLCADYRAKYPAALEVKTQ